MSLPASRRDIKPEWFAGAARGVRWGCAVMSLLASTSVMTGPVAAQRADDGGAASMAFDIPPQPLSDALYQYTSVTGIDILVPSDLLSQRRSSGVSGVRRPDDALAALLSDSGLMPRQTGANAFTLVPAPARRTAAHVPRHLRYSGALQAAVTKVLCRLPETGPASFRVAARLWVGPSGEVTRVGLLGSTGDADRDAALAGVFKQVVIGEPPSSDVPQPTTVVVRRGPETAAECQALAAARAAP